MTIESTEHGARSTEHGTPVDGALVLRSAAFVDQRNADVATNGARSTERSVERSASPERSNGAERSVERSAPRAWAFRGRKERSAGLAEHVENARRNAAIAERERSALATERAIALRRSARKTRSVRQTAEQIAPLPTWMVISGIWFDRVFGALPLVAPLVTSGFFTARVMTDDPINAPLAVAVIITLALEGGVWKLAKLLEKTLLEGDSTISLRLGILVYLALISGGIFGHAYYQAYDAADGGKVVLTWGDWLPAAATALMSMLGVYIWSKDARFKHRVELRNLNLIDSQAPKFSLLAWVFLPIETGKAFKHAIRFRIASPTLAVADRRLWVEAGKPKVWNVEHDGADEAEQHAEESTATRNAGRNAPSGRTERGTERNAERNGTRNGVQQGTERQPAERSVERSVLAELEADVVGESAPLEQNAEHRAPQRNANLASRNTDKSVGSDERGARSTERGTERSAEHGTQDEVSAETMRLAPLLLDVVAQHKGWAEKVPATRAIIAAIDTERRKRGEVGFNSAGVASKVQKELIRLAGHPDGANQLDKLRDNSN